MNSIYFFANGNTAVCKKGEQVPSLQKPWVTTFARFLAMMGESPEDYEVFLPDGKKAKFKESIDGWTWEISS